jgi:hypothetical protein
MSIAHPLNARRLILSSVYRCVAIDGGFNNTIYLLLTGRKYNYNNIADFHTLQITTEHTKLFPPAVYLLDVSW